MTAAKKRNDRPRSYRFREEDLALIDRLRGRLAAKVGPRLAEVEVLRAGLRALARESGLEESPTVRVERADDVEPSIEEIDRDFAVLASLCENSEPAEEEQLERALQEVQRLAKEQVRRRMEQS